MIGPTLAETLGPTMGWGTLFEWAWLMLQWALVFALVATGIGLIYFFGPDADQDWVWITPGAAAATTLWLVTSGDTRTWRSKWRAGAPKRKRFERRGAPVGRSGQNLCRFSSVNSSPSSCVSVATSLRGRRGR